MTLPNIDTFVTYPAGDLSARASVIHVEHLDNATAAVILDRTSFHPVDPNWPDQGADHGFLLLGTYSTGTDSNSTDSSGTDSSAKKIEILDAVVGRVEGGTLSLDRPVLAGAQVSAAGDAGANQPASSAPSASVAAPTLSTSTTPSASVKVVAHLVAAADAPREGDTVEIIAEAEHRQALSYGHTACHLAALALNAALSSQWKKPARLDDMGHPNFDQVANDSSRIRQYGSTDTYRLGKSLRKKGFIVDGLANDLPAIEKDLNDTLEGWVQTGALVRIERDGDLLTDRRIWACELPGGAVRIPCGGTHAQSLAQLGSVTATLTLGDVEGTPLLSMTTTVDKP